jgi:hypothetical protein
MGKFDTYAILFLGLLVARFTVCGCGDGIPVGKVRLESGSCV